MKYLFVLCAICISPLVSAQHLVVGASTGLDYWMHRSSLFQHRYHNCGLGEGAFIRWESKKRWGYEAGLQHSAYKEHLEYHEVIYDGPGHVFINEDYDINTFIVALKADFRLTKDTKSRFTQNIGLQLRPTLWMETFKEHLYDPATLKPVGASSITGKVFRFWAGAHYSVCYRIGPRWQIRAVVSYTVDPYRLFTSDESYFNNSDSYGKASLDFGIAYSLH